MLSLRLRGGKLLVAVTRERRYGPSRLRVDDDNDAPTGWLKIKYPTSGLILKMLEAA